MNPSRMFEKLLTAQMIPTLRARASEEQLRGNQTVEFRTAVGAVFQSAAPLTKMTLELAWRSSPAPRRIAEVIEEAAKTLSISPEQLAGPLQQTLTELPIAWTLRLASICITPPPAAIEVGERPEAWRVARYQASLGMLALTNMRHEVVKLEPNQQHVQKLITQLDGSRTVQQASSDPSASKIVQGLAAYALLAR
jgi:hypothetical protein